MFWEGNLEWGEAQIKGYSTLFTLGVLVERSCWSGRAQGFSKRRFSTVNMPKNSDIKVQDLLVQGSRHLERSNIREGIGTSAWEVKALLEASIEDGECSERVEKSPSLSGLFFGQGKKFWRDRVPEILQYVRNEFLLYNSSCYPFFYAFNRKLTVKII